MKNNTAYEKARWWVYISIYYWLLLAQLLTRWGTNLSLICRSEILWSQRPDVTVLLYQSLTFGVSAFSSGSKLTDFCDEPINVPRIYIILIWHEFPLFKTILCVHYHKTSKNKKFCSDIIIDPTKHHATSKIYMPKIPF